MAWPAIAGPTAFVARLNMDSCLTSICSWDKFWQAIYALLPGHQRRLSHQKLATRNLRESTGGHD